MKIYLLRHGTTPWNEARRIQGKTDIPLDGPGEAIARMTGEALHKQGISFRYIFSSPLSRAVRTASLVAPQATIQTDPRLAELSFGRFEGQSVPVLGADPACPFRFFKTDPARYDQELRFLEETCPGEHFESLTTLCSRTRAFLMEVIEPLARTEPENACVLISGHGAMNRGLMMHILGQTDLSAFWGKGLQVNCGLFEIEARAGQKGAILYETTEECLTFYDPKALPDIPGLL